VLTGICVGGGTIAFFLLFQKGGPLSAVPIVLAGGAALMGGCGHSLFQGAGCMASVAGNRFGRGRVVFVAFACWKVIATFDV